MPMTQIEGCRWVLDRFITEKHVIIWPSVPPDTPAEFDGRTRCILPKHLRTPKAKEKGYALAGSTEILGNVGLGLVCQTCYQALRSLDEQLRNWEKQTVKVLKGQPLPE